MKIRFSVEILCTASLGSLFVLWLSACGPSSDQLFSDSKQAAAVERKWKAVILITVDTLRADHLGVYGYHMPTSPNIDELAQESLVFERAISTCPATAPATASILTGHHRAAHGVARNGSVMPDEAVESLAEFFRRRGYHTAGFVANPTLDEELGFAQGFDDFAFPDSLIQGGPSRYGGEPLVEEARRVLEQRVLDGVPLFLWIHFMDPHGAYHPPEDIRALFQPRDYADSEQALVPLSEENHGLGIIPRYQRLRGQKPGMSLAPVELEVRYDAEIRYVDTHIGHLITLLRDLGFWEETLLVLTADHGESLGEHNYYFQHGWFTYEDSIRVPLLIRLPGEKEQVRVTQTVSIIDLAPTIMELTGLEVPPEMEGVNLLRLRGGDEDRVAFSQTYYGNQLTAITWGRYKYIYTPPPPKPEADNRKPDGWKNYWPQDSAEELYDLEADPQEMNNIAKEHRDVVFTMRRMLREWLKDQAIRQAALLSRLEGDAQYSKQIKKMERDVRLKEQLEALGYL